MTRRRRRRKQQTPRCDESETKESDPCLHGRAELSWKEHRCRGVTMAEENKNGRGRWFPLDRAERLFRVTTSKMVVNVEQPFSR